MDWDWIFWLTIRLTINNLIRIKNSLISLIHQNPELSAVGFVVLFVLAASLVYRYAHAHEKK